MNDPWSPALTWLSRTAAGGGLVLLLAALLMVLTKQPARRQRLGEWAVAASLLLAVLCLRPSWLVLNVPFPSNSVLTTDPRPSMDGQDPAALLLPVASPALTTSEIATSTGKAESSTSWWQQGYEAWLVPAYVSILSFWAARWLVGWWGLTRLLHHAGPAPVEVQRLFDALTDDWKRRPRLLVSARLDVPVSCGLWRPTVVLPASLCSPADEQALRWIFAHELTHLMRRDAWSGLLLAVGQMVYFYLPWLWWLRRQVRLCQEYVADAAVVGGEADTENYAQFLLDLVNRRAVPLHAAGVCGRSSDLFRRVTMLVRKPAGLEKRCPRLWSWSASAGLLALAVVVSGITLRAGDSGKGQGPAKPKAPPVPLTPITVSPFAAPEGGQQQQVAGGPPPGTGFVFSDPNYPERLGVSVSTPSEALADQLGLAPGRGLVIERVKLGSSADKVGVKPHDILLELAGKPLPFDDYGLLQFISAVVHGKTPVDVVILRKGKKETLKGMQLPPLDREVIRLMRTRGLAVQPPAPPSWTPAKVGTPITGSAVLTTSFRSGNRFTTRCQEGSLIVTVTGTVTGVASETKSKISEIHVQDGMENSTYPKLDKVPARHRDKVEHVIKLCEWNNSKIDVIEKAVPVEIKP